MFPSRKYNVCSINDAFEINKVTFPHTLSSLFALSPDVHALSFPFFNVKLFIRDVTHGFSD